MNDPIRVVIGAGPLSRVPALVCEHSIRARTKREVEVVHTFGRDDRPKLSIPGRQFRYPEGPTEFSLVRFQVPELLGYEGFGIYLDSDMILRTDIGELWDQADILRGSAVSPLGVLATRICHSVLVLDCETLEKWNDGEPYWSVDQIVRDLEAGTVTYGEVQQGLYHANAGGLVGYTLGYPLDPLWNCRDENPEGAKLIHYTNMNRQPWIKAGHPLGGLWYDELRDACEKDRISFEDFATHIPEGEDVPAPEVPDR